MLFCPAGEKLLHGKYSVRLPLGVHEAGLFPRRGRGWSPFGRPGGLDVVPIVCAADSRLLTIAPRTEGRVVRNVTTRRGV